MQILKKFDIEADFPEKKFTLRVIMRSIILLGSFFSILLISCCDTCNTGGPGDNDYSEDIFFSALPVRSTQPSVFAVSPDGKNLREVLKNGIIYSSPSSGYKIALLMQDAQGDTILAVGSTLSDSVRTISLNKKYKRIFNPVISQNDKYIAVATDTKELLIVANEVYTQFPSYNYCETSVASFSPDSRYLAFYEGDSLQSALTLKVVLSDYPKQVVFSKTYPDGLSQWKGDATISWASDGSFFCYVITNSGDGYDYIIANKIDGSEVFRMQIIGIGASQPEVSPDNASVAFAAKDGNIWRRTISDGRSYKITNVDSTEEFCVYPQWTHDGKKILYSRFEKTAVIGHFEGTLEIYNLETKRNMILGNDVFRGFQIKK
ncbi:MAG: hypothetical protein WCT77_01425 [Bacteroidota bacterium]|jgi:Tol biopolymer transport system component